MVKNFAMTNLRAASTATLVWLLHAHQDNVLMANGQWPVTTADISCLHLHFNFEKFLKFKDLLAIACAWQASATQ
jgi:hypothetical protein